MNPQINPGDRVESARDHDEAGIVIRVFVRDNMEWACVRMDDGRELTRRTDEWCR